MRLPHILLLHTNDTQWCFKISEMSTTPTGKTKTTPTVHVGGIKEVEDVLAASPHRVSVICFRGSRDKGSANANLAKSYIEIVCDDLKGPLDGYTPPDTALDAVLVPDLALHPVGYGLLVLVRQKNEQCAPARWKVLTARSKGSTAWPKSSTTWPDGLVVW